MVSQEWTDGGGAKPNVKAGRRCSRKLCSRSLPAACATHFNCSPTAAHNRLSAKPRRKDSPPTVLVGRLEDA